MDVKPDPSRSDCARSESSPYGEPRLPHPGWPRYTDIPFPAYRYVPGVNAHPRKHFKGHSYGRAEIQISSWEPEEWRHLETYLFGVDLYNYAYWWESHERFEGLWRTAGRREIKGRFLQGIIQIAAANLHRHMKKLEGARQQAEKGIANLEAALSKGSVYMGLDVAEFAHDCRGYFFDCLSHPAMILLRTD